MAFDAFTGLLVLFSTVFVIVAPIFGQMFGQNFGQMYGSVPMQLPIFRGPIMSMFPPNYMMNRNFLLRQPQMVYRPVVRSVIRPAIDPVWNQNFNRQPLITRRISVRPTHTVRQPLVVNTGGSHYVNKKRVIQKPKLKPLPKPTSTKPTKPGKHNVLNYVRPHPKPVFPMSFKKKSLFAGIAKAKHFHRLIPGG